MDKERSVDRWRWRRRIALVSLGAALLYPVLAAFGPAAIVEIAWPLYAFLGANVGAYIGTAAWEEIKIPR